MGARRELDLSRVTLVKSLNGNGSTKISIFDPGVMLPGNVGCSLRVLHAPWFVRSSHLFSWRERESIRVVDPTGAGCDWNSSTAA